MTSLQIVEPRFVDKAWKEGAACLSEACDTSGGEITGDQLKMILSRGERVLCRLDDDGVAVGWGCYRIDQLPNVRVLHIGDLVCHNANFQMFWQELKNIAAVCGCSEVRWSCGKARARLFSMKLKDEEIKPVYTTYRVTL